MRISAKGYAIRALLDLAVHHGQPGAHSGGRPPAGHPQRYLEQVLLLLKRAGLLESKRGSTGYQLLRAPEAISVGEVLRAVEGRVTALEVAGRHPRSATESTSTDLAPLWREIAGAVAGVTDRVTFGDLAEQVKARRSPSARSTTSDQRSPRKTMAGRPRIADSVLDLIGNTPLVRLNRLPGTGSATVLAKVESQNPGGSVKDRIARSMIEDAERRGVLRRARRSSSRPAGTPGSAWRWWR